MLERSKDAPLHVSAFVAHSFPRPMWDALLATLSNMHRISSLDLSVYDDRSKVINDLLTSPAPILRTFTMMYESTSFHSEKNKFGPVFPRNLFNANAPCLKDITLAHCAMDWQSNILKDLTHFRMLYPAPSQAATFSQIVAILRNSPSLEVLVLSDALSDVASQSHVMESVRLARLRTLTLTSSCVTAVCLLRSIVIPPSTSVQLKVTVPSDALFDFRPLVDALDGCGCPLARILDVESRGSLSIHQRFNSDSLLFSVHGDLDNVPQISLSYARANVVFGRRKSERFEGMMRDVCGALPLSQHLRHLQLVGPSVLRCMGDAFRGCNELVFLRVSDNSFYTPLDTQIFFPSLRHLMISCNLPDQDPSAGERLRYMLYFRACNGAPLANLILEGSHFKYMDLEPFKEYVEDITVSSTYT